MRRIHDEDCPGLFGGVCVCDAGWVDDADELDDDTFYGDDDYGHDGAAL